MMGRVVITCIALAGAMASAASAQTPQKKRPALELWQGLHLGEAKSSVLKKYPDAIARSESSNALTLEEILYGDSLADVALVFDRERLTIVRIEPKTVDGSRESNLKTYMKINTLLKRKYGAPYHCDIKEEVVTLEYDCKWIVGQLFIWHLFSDVQGNNPRTWVVYKERPVGIDDNL